MCTCGPEPFSQVNSKVYLLFLPSFSLIPCLFAALLFLVNYSESAQQKFEERRAGRKVFHAFHGSKLENFHSILHFGLQGHMNKVGEYGKKNFF